MCPRPVYKTHRLDLTPSSDAVECFPSRDLFALILFTTLHLKQETVELFRTVARSAKTSIVPHTFRVFSPA